MGKLGASPALPCPTLLRNIQTRLHGGTCAMRLARTSSLDGYVMTLYRLSVPLDIPVSAEFEL
jgi:hypothetical protein